MKRTLNQFLSRFGKFILDKKVILIVYIIIAIITANKQYWRGNYNNYRIFKQVFWHSVEQLNLYAHYPLEYFDSNYYGPVFALLIAPFAVLPDVVGAICWNIINVLVLWYGIFQLPVTEKQRSWIGLICLHETLTALFSFQFNIALTGLVLLTFSAIVKQQDIKAAALIILGFLVKLYGIVGLAFFFFSKNKVKFILAGVILLPIMAFLPAIISNPSFVIHSYQEWFQAIVSKNQLNASLTTMQDISIMGMVRRISGDSSIPSSPFLLGGIIFFALPYLRISQYKNINFQLALLSSVLIFTVIFSSSSESPTYIIAMAGVAIWFITQPTPRTKGIIALFIFAMLLTSFSPSDLFPKFIREHYIQPYSLKALPCVIIWFTLIYQMLTRDYKKI